jgi:hypothetical protein
VLRSIVSAVIIAPSPLLNTRFAWFSAANRVPVTVAYAVTTIALPALVYTLLARRRASLTVDWAALGRHAASAAGDACAQSTPSHLAAHAATLRDAMRQLAALVAFERLYVLSTYVLLGVAMAVVLVIEHAWARAPLALVQHVRYGIILFYADGSYGRWRENAIASGGAVAAYSLINLCFLVHAVGSLSPEAAADAGTRLYLRTSGKYISQVCRGDTEGGGGGRGLGNCPVRCVTAGHHHGGDVGHSGAGGVRA